MNEEISKLRSELQEVTEKFNNDLLLLEAKCKYPIGTKYKDIKSSNCLIIKGVLEYFKYGLHPTSDQITDGFGGAVYDNGEWAEIIPEEKQIEADFIDNIKTFTDKSMFPDEEKKEDHCFKTGDTVKIIENSSYCGLNGVVLNTSDRFAFVNIDGTFENINFQFKDLIKIKGVDEQSLHAQIREGGWSKVYHLAGSGWKDITEYPDVIAASPVFIKLSAYERLLALEKVLNEGKETDDKIYTIYLDRGELKVLPCFDIIPAIWFHLKVDAWFALDFAEKEFKLFYNHK